MRMFLICSPGTHGPWRDEQLAVRTVRGEGTYAGCVLQDRWHPQRAVLSIADAATARHTGLSEVLYSPFVLHHVDICAHPDVLCCVRILHVYDVLAYGPYLPCHHSEIM